METKTQHMRRMRLRRKYWRVTPASPPLILTYRGATVMCDDQSDYDADVPAVADAARAMSAALQRALFYIETMIENDAENDIDSVDAKVDLDAAQQALALARKAGIK